MKHLFTEMDALFFVQIIISLAIGGVILLLIKVAASRFRRQDPAERRFEAIAGNMNKSLGYQKDNIGIKRLLGNVLKRIALSSKGKDGWEKSKIRRNLMVAGFGSPDSLNIFMGIRIVTILMMPVVAVAIAMILRVNQQIFIVLVVTGAVLGFIIPSYILEKLGNSRGKKIIKEMPNMLDLLVIAVEAGLGLDAAIKRVTRDMAISCPTLADELSIFSLEVRFGIPHNEALGNLAKRCGVEEMGGLVAMLIQAERFGVSVGRSLRVYSDEMRTKRRQQLQEMASKIPLKLLFPVLFMIFPAIMAVMAGPAILNIKESMF